MTVAWKQRGTELTQVRLLSYYAQIYNDLVFNTLKKRLGEHGAAVFARAATAGGQRFPVHVRPHLLTISRRTANFIRIGSGEVTANLPTRPWQNHFEAVSV